MSESTEMYLETILILKERNGYVRSIDLAHEMHFSKPTISQQMKRLKEKGLVEIDEKGHISLSPSGLSVGRMIYERHQLLTTILLHIGVVEDIARKDACRLEHYISQETVTAFKTYFHDIIETDQLG